MHIVNKVNEDDGILNNFTQLLEFKDASESDPDCSFSLIINGILTVEQLTELKEKVGDPKNDPEWQTYDIEKQAIEILKKMGYSIIEFDYTKIYY